QALRGLVLHEERRNEAVIRRAQSFSRQNAAKITQAAMQRLIGSNRVLKRPNASRNSARFRTGRPLCLSQGPVRYLQRWSFVPSQDLHCVLNKASSSEQQPKSDRP